jgi:protein-tyrosine phosphatase
VNEQSELPLAEEGLIDIHSHLVPGVDDGSRDLGESLAALDRLAAAGVTRVLTTPHIDASIVARSEVFGRIQSAVEAAWRRVVEACRERQPGMSLHLGHEIMLDAALPALDDPRVRLNGGRYVLVEFPRLNIPPGTEDVLYHILGGGRIPVVAHVERYFYHGLEDQTLEEWRHTGAVFQVNTASLLGGYGTVARHLAWELVSRGWVGVLASDYHARGETWIPEARAALAEHGGTEQERLLLRANPRRIVMDEPIEDVPPLEIARSGGAWARLRGMFRS